MSGDEGDQYESTDKMDRDEIVDTFAKLGAVGKEANNYLDPQILRRFLESEKAEGAVQETAPEDAEGDEGTIQLDLGELGDFLVENDEVPDHERESDGDSASPDLDPKEVQYIVEGDVEEDAGDDSGGTVSLHKGAVRQFIDEEDGGEEDAAEEEAADDSGGTVSLHEGAVRQFVDEEKAADSEPADEQEEDEGGGTVNLHQGAVRQFVDEENAGEEDPADGDAPTGDAADGGGPEGGALEGYAAVEDPENDKHPGRSDVHYIDHDAAREEIESKRDRGRDGSGGASETGPATELQRKIQNSDGESSADERDEQPRSRFVPIVLMLAGAGLVVGVTAGYLYRSGDWQTDRADGATQTDRAAAVGEERNADPVGTDQKEEPKVEKALGTAGRRDTGEASGAAAAGDEGGPSRDASAGSAAPSDRRIAIDERVHFRVDSTKLHTDSRVILDQIAGTLKKHRELSPVRIVGHADGEGTAETNRRVSLLRAQRVEDYLLDQGIEADRLETVAHGAKKPVASNDTRRGRARNRRVEIIAPAAKPDAGSSSGGAR